MTMEGNSKSKSDNIEIAEPLNSDDESDEQNSFNTPKNIFDKIIEESERLKATGDARVLQDFAYKMHELYFSSSNDLFSMLSLQDNFNMVMRVNKIDELQGAIGQAGVGQLVYRLAGFQYNENLNSNNEIGLFIQKLLEGKNISEAVAILYQLKTVAAYALGNGDWAEPVYDGIQAYFKTHKPEDVFILTKLKEYLSDSLEPEESKPSLGIVTTLENRHGALMYENLVFDEELNSKINNAYSFNSALCVRVDTISRDYLGIFDTRNRLISLVPIKSIDVHALQSAENRSGLQNMEAFYTVARFLNDRRYKVLNKVINVFTNGILKINTDSPIIALLSSVISITDTELVAYFENEKKYYALEASGHEVPDEIKLKSKQMYAAMRGARVQPQQMIELERMTYEEFNKKYDERAANRQPIETLDLNDPNGLNFLGCDESNIELFKALQNPYISHTIQESFGITLSHLDMRAQSAFLSYFSTANEADVKRFADLLAPFEEEDREKICSAYLAFENDEILGSAIEKILERPETALSVISVVYKLIGNASNIEDFLLSEFKQPADRKTISLLYEKLIRTAKSILLRYGSKLTAEARHEMETLNINQVLFLNSFQSLKEGGIEFSLEDIANSSLERLSGQELSPEQAEQMRTMYEKNQSANPAVQQELLQRFTEKLSDDKTNFYLFSYTNNIQSFVALTPRGDGTIYASAFNVAPDARGYKIGEAMLIEVIDKEAREHVLSADCTAGLPISAKYIETGWVATNFWNDHGDKILDIKRDDARNNEYEGKTLSKEDIIAGKVPHGTLVETSIEQRDLPFSLCNEGYILTRMFFDPATARHYAVFESAPPSRRA